MKIIAKKISAGCLKKGEDDQYRYSECLGSFLLVYAHMHIHIHFLYVYGMYHTECVSQNYLKTTVRYDNLIKLIYL